MKTISFIIFCLFTTLVFAQSDHKPIDFDPEKFKEKLNGRTVPEYFRDTLREQYSIETEGMTREEILKYNRTHLEELATKVGDRVLAEAEAFGTNAEVIGMIRELRDRYTDLVKDEDGRFSKFRRKAKKIKPLADEFKSNMKELFENRKKKGLELALEKRRKKENEDKFALSNLAGERKEKEVKRKLTDSQIDKTQSQKERNNRDPSSQTEQSTSNLVWLIFALLGFGFIFFAFKKIKK